MGRGSAGGGGGGLSDRQLGAAVANATNTDAQATRLFNRIEREAQARGGANPTRVAQLRRELLNEAIDG